jgi:3-dehydroquinate synthase
MRSLLQRFTVPYQYAVHFTSNAFASDNTVLVDTLRAAGTGPHRVLIVIDEGLLRAECGIANQIEEYATRYRGTMHLVCAPLVISGGEDSKNGVDVYNSVSSAIH